MKFKEYVTLAVRTESCDMELIRSRLENDNVIRMLHAGLGMTTEVAELFESLENDDDVNKKEELGDLFWYIAVAFDATRAEFGDTLVMPGSWMTMWMGMNLEETKKALSSATAEYVDVLKRTIFYDKYCLEVKKVETLLMNIYKLALWMVGVIGAGKPGEVLVDNIEKLKKRYGEKFNEGGALHRDTKKELSHFNGAGESDR